VSSVPDTVREFLLKYVTLAERSVRSHWWKGNYEMRLYVVNEDLRVLWRGVGVFQPDGVYSQGELVLKPGPNDRVLTPTWEHGPDVWRLLKIEDGGFVFMCPRHPEKGGVFLDAELLESRAEEPESDCLVAAIDGNETWFKQIESPAVFSVDADNESLTYEEEYERGPGDSFGPSDTIIP